MNALILKQLQAIERSARVRRYHTEPLLHAQNVGEHTYAVMWLIMLLTDGEASRDLLLAALQHDTPEFSTGDIPAPTKRLTGMKAAFDALEDGVMSDLEWPPMRLTVDEARTLKMADNLEGLMFCGFELRRGNLDILWAMSNYLNFIQQTAPTGLALEIWTHYKEKFDAASK